MSFDRMRLYDAERFHDTELPDWYHEADLLSQKERLDRHRSFDRVLDCEHTLLTGEGAQSGWIEVRFWPSPTQGIFVLVETALGLIEQVVILNPTDWLPFLTQHLTPLIAVAAQSAMLDQQLRITNAFTSWGRHGEGSHVDRETGLSRIDLDNDLDRRRAAQFRQAMAQADKEGVA
jgi:hypothetical protein